MPPPAAADAMSRSLALAALLLLVLPPLAAPTGKASEAPPLQAVAFERARERFAAGDFAAVVAALEPFANSGAAAPPLRTLLAAAYLRLARAGDALALLAPVADAEGAGAPLLYQAASAAAALGDEARAERYLARAAAADPASQAARTLGLSRGAQGRPEDACRLLRPFVSAHPEDEEARLGAAFCSLELGDEDGAAELLRELPAGVPRVRLLRGRLALVRGEPYETIAQLEPLLPSPPPEVEHEVRRNLAEAYLEVGRAPAAIPLLRAHAAGSPELTLMLARAHQQAGEPAAAVAAVAPFAEQLTAAPPPPGLPLSLGAAMALEWGRALISLRRWAEAVTALQAATRLNPTSPAAWQALVQALRGAGRPAEAQAAAARLLGLTKPVP